MRENEVAVYELPFVIERFGFMTFVNDVSPIVRRSAVWAKDGKKWIEPTDSMLKSGDYPMFLSVQGAPKRPIAEIVAIGDKEQLRVQTSDGGRRIPVHKKRTFSPHHEPTKSEMQATKLKKQKKQSVADRKMLAHAREKSERNADAAYHDFAIASSGGGTAPADTPMSNDGCHDSGKLDSDMTILNSTPKSNTTSGRSLPRSLTMHDLEGQGMSVSGNVEHEAATSTPLVLLSNTLTKPAASCRGNKKKTFDAGSALELEKIRDSIVEGFSHLQSTLAKAVETFHKSVVGNLLKIHADLIVLKTKVVTVEDLNNVCGEQLVGRIARAPTATENSDTNEPDETNYLEADEDGQVELCPGLKCSYEAYSAAVLAKTSRRRANEVMRILWTDDMILKRFVKPPPAAVRAARDCDDSGEGKIPTTEYMKLIRICKALQRTKRIPEPTDNDKIQFNAKTWASDWLKNRRQRIKDKSTRKSPTPAP